MGDVNPPLPRFYNTVRNVLLICPFWWLLGQQIWNEFLNLKKLTFLILPCTPSLQCKELGLEGEKAEVWYFFAVVCKYIFMN